MKVEFKFEVDQKVITPFQTQGIISHCCVGRDANSYYVKTEKSSEWFYEDQLFLINKN